MTCDRCMETHTGRRKDADTQTNTYNEVYKMMLHMYMPMLRRRYDHSYQSPGDSLSSDSVTSDSRPM